MTASETFKLPRPQFQQDLDTFTKLVDDKVKELVAGNTQQDPTYFQNRFPEYMQVINPAAEALAEKYSTYMSKTELKQFRELLQKRVELGLNFFYLLVTTPEQAMDGNR